MAAGSCMLPAAIAQGSAPSKGSNAGGTSASPAKTTGTIRKTSASRKGSSKRRSRRVKGQTAPMPDRIGEIQAALAKDNSYEGVPTGKWDDSTAAALKRFQAAHGLTPTGKLDALTLQKLGLGSETTGLGAPTPPPNAAANRLLTRSAQREEIKNEVQPE
jgi:peptidoglycan hydrolase-like protein with peptidoglycan-binding domain